MTDICVLGNFVADNTFYSEKLPTKGQTVFGSGFQVGPGGKGSNQAIAAARLKSKVSFCFWCWIYKFFDTLCITHYSRIYFLYNW